MVVGFQQQNAEREAAASGTAVSRTAASAGRFFVLVASGVAHRTAAQTAAPFLNPFCGSGHVFLSAPWPVVFHKSSLISLRFWFAVNRFRLLYMIFA